MLATNNNEWVDRLTPAPQGEGGFDACWYPVAMSDEVAPGAFHRAEFLDGHVIVLRTSTGEVSVLSPYCRHYGADLSDGDMENGCLIRCPLHHWKYDASGQCVETAGGERVPTDTTLFKFPTQEKWGLIWAFNGLDPDYDVPSWEEAEEDRHFTVFIAADYPGDPFIATMNVIDTQHLRALHGLDVEDVNLVSDGGSFHADMTISGDYVGLPETTRHVELIGTNAAVYSRATTGIDMLAAATPYRGRTRLYIVTGGLRSAYDPDEIEEQVAIRQNATAIVLQQDLPVLQNMRFRPERATKSDRATHDFLRFAVGYPRAHPAKDFIT